MLKRNSDKKMGQSLSAGANTRNVYVVFGYVDPKLVYYDKIGLTQCNCFTCEPCKSSNEILPPETDHTLSKFTPVVIDVPSIFQ